MRTVLAAAWLLAAIPDDEPLHLWRLTEVHCREGAFPAAAGGLPARPTGPVRFAPGKPPALLFGAAPRDPQNPGKPPRTYLVVTEDLAAARLPSEALSVEAWAMVDRPEKWGGLVGAHQDNGPFERGWVLGFNETGFSFAVAGQARKRLTYLAGPQALQAGFWYHVVGTYDGREQRLYVDGRLEARGTEQSGPIAYPEKGVFVVGAYRDDDEVHPLEGRIEQAAVWGRALPEKEVKARFEARKADFPGIEPVRPGVADWPTHLRDNHRTGLSDEEPRLPLRLAWVHEARHAPRPAWPPPAKQDFYNKKSNLPPRVVFDRALPLAAAGDLVVFSSSADDQVRGIDAASGEPRWTFFAEGPVRLAPALAGGRVFFGSDDGCVYALRASDGRLLWKHRPAGEDRRIAGNERVISSRPARAGVLVEEDAAWYGAGIFPAEGVLTGALDAATGREIFGKAASFAPQGYMERRGDRFFVPTGHDLFGAFVPAPRSAAKIPPFPAPRLPPEYPCALIGAGSVRFAGGDGRVAALGAEDGRVRWSAEVEGKALILAFAGGRLLVSTDRGRLYAFDSGEGAPRSVKLPPPRLPPDDPAAAAEAERLLGLLEPPGRGYALVLGSGGGRLLLELARRSGLTLVGVEDDPAKVAASRALLDEAGLYGRASIHALDPRGRLPYADGLFNLAVDATSGRAADRPEVLRVTRPWGGAAVTRNVARRGPLEGAGEWTHLYADPAQTASSGDALVGSALRLQWFGLPGPREMVDRHHRTVSPLCKDGRLFVPGYDRVTAVDAFNGALLWEAEVPDSRRMVAFRDCGGMALAADALYLAAAGRALAFDPATGRRLGEFRPPPAADGRARHWGYLAVQGDLLLGSAVRPEAIRRVQSLEVDMTETYWDFVPAVCSEEVFALDRRKGTVLWTRRSEGMIHNPTLTLSDGTFFLVEGAFQGGGGRARLRDLLGTGGRLLALEARTGAPRWEARPDLKAEHNLFAAAAAGRLALVGSRNDGKDRKTARVLYDIQVFHAATGQPAWSRTMDTGLGIGGEHGEQDRHPVIAGGRLIVEPWAWDLRTGEPAGGWAWRDRRRKGCGLLSASASALFFRDDTASAFDLGSQKQRSVSGVSRPGCFINMIPACGMLLIPEASSGCTCNYGVQASMGFAPAR